MSLKTAEVVYSVEFSPFQHSSNLLAIGGRTGITIKACTLKESALQEGCSLLESLEFTDVLCVDSGHNGRHTAIAWSPESVGGGEGDSVIRFCSAASDHKIRSFCSDHHGTTSEVLGGHSSYVNSIAAHPTNPSLLASVGDDHCCYLWDLEAGQLGSVLKLESPGMEVAWHPRDPMKLLVAEKSGGIRFYDMTTEIPIMTLDVWSPSHQLAPPLLSADWSPSNSLRVGCVANGYWALWDVAQSSYPLEVKPAHHGPATKFRWCPQSDQVFATLGNGNQGYQVKVHHVGHQKVPISSDLPAVSSLSWHSRLPLLAVSGDHTIKFWTVES